MPQSWQLSISADHSVFLRGYHTFSNNHYISALALPLHRTDRRTGNHPSPPNWIPQIRQVFRYTVSPHSFSYASDQIENLQAFLGEF